MQALVPFLAEACQPLAGQLFDAEVFANAVSDKFGLRIPRLAALGLTEQLEREGILEALSGHASKVVYRYVSLNLSRSAPVDSPVTEAEIEAVLASFASFCAQDEVLSHLDGSTLEKEFLDRLINVDSMRLLVRREASIATKQTPTTISLKAGKELHDDSVEFHLDYAVSQFLLDLQTNDPTAFERVSDIAFANMAAEAIALFRDPPASQPGTEALTVYLDSPLLLDMLGVNSEYASYGKELLETIKKSGTEPAAFDHCIAEAESAIAAQLTHLRSGINRVATHWGTSANPDLLSALMGRVAERAVDSLGITVRRDPEVNLHKFNQSLVGDVEAEMQSRMQAWKKEEAKDYDRKSVWAMLAMRDTSSIVRRVCDAKTLLLTRNTPLVSIANKVWRLWLDGKTKGSRAQIDLAAPIAMSDKQFAGYLWGRSGGSDMAMSRARLLAHCSAAVRPRADIKARAYNLMLELSGKDEADHLAALMEDREGAATLMRVTRGDPEDLTRERMPFILEQVKISAGEYAAGKVREEKQREVDDLAARHEREVAQLQQDAGVRQSKVEEDLRKLESRLLEQDFVAQALVAQNDTLIVAMRAQEQREADRRDRILADSFSAGRAVYIRLRWEAAILFGLVAGGAATLIGDWSPGLAVGIACFTAFLGFWFVPEVLERPIAAVAKKEMDRVMRLRDASVPVPTAVPNFRLAA